VLCDSQPATPPFATPNALLCVMSPPWIDLYSKCYATFQMVAVKTLHLLCRPFRGPSAISIRRHHEACFRQALHLPRLLASLRSSARSPPSPPSSHLHFWRPQNERLLNADMQPDLVSEPVLFGCHPPHSHPEIPLWSFLFFNELKMSKLLSFSLLATVNKPIAPTFPC
jgi:hypothetical protein